MRLTRLILIVLCAFSTVLSNAQNVSEIGTCKIDYTTYIHINGINTEDEEAFRNAENLSVKINKKVNFAYNKKDGVLSDIWETLRQKVNEFPDLTEAEFAQIAQDYSVERQGTREFQKAIKKLRFEKAKSFGNVSLADPSMAEIRAKIDEFTQFAPPVALLPHSQGNLYAQGVYNHLIQTRLYPSYNVGVFGIATPGDYVPGSNGKYVTSNQDGVIGLLRLFFWNVLPGNVDISSNANDWLGHNLIKIYLDPTLEALQLIQAGIKALVQPFEAYTNEAKATGVLFAGPATTQQYNDKIGLWIQEPTGQITPFSPKNQGLFTTQGGFSVPGTNSVVFGAYYELLCNKMKAGQYTVFTNDEIMRSNETANLDIAFKLYANGVKVDAPLSFTRVSQFTNTTNLRPVLSWTVTADEPNNRYVVTPGPRGK
jgi:hypothetical protein